MEEKKGALDQVEPAAEAAGAEGKATQGDRFER